MTWFIHNLDWLAGAFELAASYAIGNKNRMGFLLNIVGNSTWIFVAVHREVYGLLLVVIPALFLSIRNWYRWGSEK